MASFIPDKLDAPVLNVPYFEDQKEHGIPGRGTDKSPQQIQTEIRNIMSRLGAGNVVFSPGKFQDKPIRYGYQITFFMAGIPGRIDIAALPIKSETAVRKEKALAQALYLVRNWLEGELFSQIYRPGNVPLLPYLIGANDVTVQEAMIKSGSLPMLKSG